MKQIEHQQRAAELPLGEVNVADPGLYQLGGYSDRQHHVGPGAPEFCVDGPTGPHPSAPARWSASIPTSFAAFILARADHHLIVI